MYSFLLVFVIELGLMNTLQNGDNGRKLGQITF